jgi:hypothetical protein
MTMQHDLPKARLVGAGEEGWGDRETESVGRLAIDVELEDLRLLDMQLAGLRAL